MIDDFVVPPDGWERDDEAVEKALPEIAAIQGLPAVFADAAPELIDAADDDKPFYAWKAEEKLFGAVKPSWNQGQVGTCFPAGTIVRMADGSEKNIEDVRSGEYVITHLSRPRQVVKTFKRRYSGPLTTVKAGGCPSSVTATSDHRFVYYSERASGQKDLRRWRVGNTSEKYVWEKIGQLGIGDRLLVPTGVPCPEHDSEVIDVVKYAPDTIPSECGEFAINASGRGKPTRRIVPIRPEVGRLFGLYLAEGNIGRNSHNNGYKPIAVVFSFHLDETELAEDVVRLIGDLFGVGCRQVTDPSHHVRKVIVNSTILAKLFHALVPGKAISKRLPDVFHRASKETRLAVLRGWMDGDGHCKIRKNGPNAKQLSLIGVSSSEGLRRDMYTLAVGCGLQPRMVLRKKMAHQNAAAGHVALYGEHAVGVIPELRSDYESIKQRPGKKAWKTELGIAAPIKTKTESYMEDGVVYCLEVEEDHSFVANGYACSNCVSFGWGRGANDLLNIMAAAGVISLPEAEVATEPIYGGSRVEVGGGRIRGDGSVGAWAAKWCLNWGLLLRKIYSKYSLERYSESLSRQWGRSGVPDELEPIAKQFPIKSVAQCNSVEEAWKGLGSGYILPICSNVGFASPYVDGFCARKGSWNHCMVVRGRVVAKHRGSNTRAYACQNSWGGYIKGEPYFTDADGNRERLPEGCFLMTENDLGAILRQTDSFLISDVQGFPRRDPMDWFI